MKRIIALTFVLVMSTMFNPLPVMAETPTADKAAGVCSPMPTLDKQAVTSALAAGEQVTPMVEVAIEALQDCNGKIQAVLDWVGPDNSEELKRLKAQKAFVAEQLATLQLMLLMDSKLENLRKLLYPDELLKIVFGLDSKFVREFRDSPTQACEDHQLSEEECEKLKNLPKQTSLYDLVMEARTVLLDR